MKKLFYIGLLSILLINCSKQECTAPAIIITTINKDVQSCKFEEDLSLTEDMFFDCDVKVEMQGDLYLNGYSLETTGDLRVLGNIYGDGVILSPNIRVDNNVYSFPILCYDDLKIDGNVQEYQECELLSTPDIQTVIIQKEVNCLDCGKVFINNKGRVVKIKCN